MSLNINFACKRKEKIERENKTIKDYPKITDFINNKIQLFDFNKIQLFREVKIKNEISKINDNNLTDREKRLIILQKMNSSGLNYTNNKKKMNNII